MKVSVGVSRRHVHLCKKTCLKLFGSADLPVRNPLKQPGQYASTLTVDLESHGEEIEHVRVCGPLRKYDQIELAKEEADLLKMNPPVRKSGDLKGSLPITLVGPNGKVSLKEGTIMAERHIHMDFKAAKKMGFKDKELVSVRRGKEEIFTAKIKIENPSFTELHIDTHEEIIYDLHQGEEVDIFKIMR